MNESTELFDLISANKIKEVRKLLRDHPEMLNQRLGTTGHSPLTHSIDNARGDIALSLLDQGAEIEPDKPFELQGTTYPSALAYGCLRVVSGEVQTQLLRRAQNINPTFGDPEESLVDHVYSTYENKAIRDQILSVILCEATIRNDMETIAEIILLVPALKAQFITFFKDYLNTIHVEPLELHNAAIAIIRMIEKNYIPSLPGYEVVSDIQKSIAQISEVLLSKLNKQFIDPYYKNDKQIFFDKSNTEDTQFANLLNNELAGNIDLMKLILGVVYNSHAMIEAACKNSDINFSVFVSKFHSLLTSDWLSVLSSEPERSEQRNTTRLGLEFLRDKKWIDDEIFDSLVGKLEAAPKMVLTSHAGKSRTLAEMVTAAKSPYIATPGDSTIHSQDQTDGEDNILDV